MNHRKQYKKVKKILEEYLEKKKDKEEADMYDKAQMENMNEFLRIVGDQQTKEKLKDVLFKRFIKYLEDNMKSEYLLKMQTMTLKEINDYVEWACLRVLQNKFSEALKVKDIEKSRLILSIQEKILQEEKNRAKTIREILNELGE